MPAKGQLTRPLYVSGHPEEAARLLGPEPSARPIEQPIDWARSLASDAIDLIHTCDWHNPGTDFADLRWCCRAPS